MHIVADSLLDIPFPDSLNLLNRGIELSKEQYYALASDSVEGRRIVAIKKYNDNFLVFFCQNRWISTILFDKDGKLLDVCDFFGVIPRKKVSIEVDIDIPIDSFCIDESLWNIKFQGDNNIELEDISEHDISKENINIEDSNNIQVSMEENKKKKKKHKKRNKKKKNKILNENLDESISKINANNNLEEKAQNNKVNKDKKIEYQKIKRR